jgi:cytochrome c oxidase subunit 3
MEQNNKKLSLQLGASIFVLLAFLTAAEFLIATNFTAVYLLVLIAVVKSALVVYYYMHITRLGNSEGQEERTSYAYKTGTNRLGLWLFILSDSFLFGGLLITRFSLMGLGRPELIQTLGLGVTVVLLTSSFFMNRAETQMAFGDRKGFLLNAMLTLILGVAFLAGVIGVEWRMAPFGPADGTQGAIFYGMTGFHAFHVLTGVIILFIIYRKAVRGLYSAEKQWAVEGAAVYWHFIDVVWFIFYPALYLIGNVF